MTLENLTTPFERRRVIEYGADGNKVVRHWYEVQHVVGSIYKSKDTLNDRGEPEFKLFVFFSDTSDGLRFEWLSHPERYTVEQVAETMRRCKVDSSTHMYVDLNERMEQNKFIGNAQIEFFRQFDSAAADCYAQYRKDFYARKAEKERVKDLERQAAEKAKQAKEQAELAAEKARYFGWVDGMTPLRFGQVSVLMDSSIRVEGKIMTRREFIINCVKDNWVPKKRMVLPPGTSAEAKLRKANPKLSISCIKTVLCMESAKLNMTLRSIWWSIMPQPMLDMTV